MTAETTTVLSATNRRAIAAAHVDVTKFLSHLLETKGLTGEYTITFVVKNGQVAEVKKNYCSVEKV